MSFVIWDKVQTKDEKLCDFTMATDISLSFRHPAFGFLFTDSTDRSGGNL